MGARTRERPMLLQGRHSPRKTSSGCAPIVVQNISVSVSPVPPALYRKLEAARTLCGALANFNLGGRGYANDRLSRRRQQYARSASDASPVRRTSGSDLHRWRISSRWLQYKPAGPRHSRNTHSTDGRHGTVAPATTGVQPTGDLAYGEMR